MRTKLIILPLWAARVRKLFDFMLILVLDTVALLLTPFTWMQFRAHLAAFIGALIAGGYWYWLGAEHAIINAVFGFVAFVFAVAFIKWFKKYLHKRARRLDKHVFSSFLPICVYVKIPNNPFKTKKEKKKEVR